MKIKGNISKEMAKKVKRRKSIKLELGGNQLALKIDYGENNNNKMVVILFDKRLVFWKWTSSSDGSLQGMLSGPNMSTFFVCLVFS